MLNLVELEGVRRFNFDVQSESSLDLPFEGATSTGATSDYHSSISDVSDIVKESVQGNTTLTPIQMAERSGQLREDIWCVQRNESQLPEETSLPTCDSPLQV